MLSAVGLWKSGAVIGEPRLRGGDRLGPRLRVPAVGRERDGHGAQPRAPQRGERARVGGRVDEHAVGGRREQREHEVQAVLRARR